MLTGFPNSLRRSRVASCRRRNQSRRRRWNSVAERLEQRSLLTTLSVTTRFDLMDPNDGVTSLREALAAASDEVANPGHDTIVFDPAVFGDGLGGGMIHADYGGFTVEYDNNLGKDVLKEWRAPNSGGQFIVNSDVTIDGSALGLVRIGHERGWAERHRIFRVDAGVTATFRNVVIQGGDSSDQDGGGIWNAGNLTLENSVVGSNYALTTGFGTRGGGIFNSATGVLTLKNTHIGEVALSGEFLDGVGVGSDFYVTEEASERTRFQTFVYRGEVVVGKSTSDATQISGNGAYGDGGGIYNQGALHVTDRSVIRGNRAYDGQKGGGVYNAGTMTIADSVVEDHIKYAENGNYAAIGAGIYNTGGLTIERSVFRNNVTNREGGAIYNAGVMTIRDSTFDGNSAIKNASQAGLPSPQGGAIFDAGIRTTIARSTFNGGTAFNGGAIANQSNPEMLLDRVTVANNSSPQGVGGGVYNIGGLATIVDSTIAWNSAMRAGGLRNGGAATTILRNTILGENTTTTTHADIQNTGTLRSAGYNLIQSASDYTFVNGTQSTDITGVDPQIGPPGNYGGVTQTIGLRAGSPAIDSGPATPVPVHDYRLQGSLSAANGGSNLVAAGGTLTSSGYQFAAGQGLTLPSTSLSFDEYSIEMAFRIDSLTPFYKKVIDFSDGASDSGLYVQEDQLRLYPYSGAVSGTNVFRPDTVHHVVLTRTRSTKEVVGWVDGVEVLRVIDLSDAALISAPNGGLRFFTDDAATSHQENVGGSLFRLRLYDTVLSSAEAQILPRSASDQRGLRGDTGRGMDRGAFESLPPVNMRVNTLDDTHDGFYGEGQLSLREAIEWANQLPGRDQIAFSPDLVSELTDASGTIALTLGELAITDDVSLYGPGADLLTLSGSGLSRIFTVSAGVTAEISGLTLTEAHGIDRGGAILNEGTLTLRGLHITGNEVVAGPGNQGYGGGIANYGTMTVDSSTIDHNTAPSNGGGIVNWGESLTITNSTLSGNSGGFGGGLHAALGTIVVESTTIAENHAATRGGGFRRFPAATMLVSNSIIARNTSPDGPDGKSEATGTISGSFNVIGVGEQTGFADGVDNNQVGSAATPFDPLLGRLRNLGGPTPVHGLLPGSPALEAANPASFPRYDQRGVARPVDVLADIGAFEYIAPSLTSPVVVDSLDGDSDGAFGPGQMSLTEAILFTNADSSLTSIDFAPSLFAGVPDRAVIQLVNTELEITGDVVINGPGSDKLQIIGAGSGFGIFEVSYSVARLRNLTVSGGDIYAAGPRRFGGALDIFHAYVLLDRVHLSDNRAEYGGAINNDSFSTLIITDSTISGSQAIWGGAILNSGVATLRNVTLSGNATDSASYSAGGAIYNSAGRSTTSDGRMTLTHTTITGNSGIRGGGIFAESGSFLTLGNTLIAGNTATDAAPDLFDDNSTLNSLGGNLLGNNSGLAGTLAGSDQFGTSANPLTVPLTDLAIIGDAKMPMHGLLPDPNGNPAINRGIAANGVSTDQRGVSRPFEGGYDVGAFEIGAADFQEFTFDNEIVVDNLSDVMDAYYGPGGMTLREAVLITNVYNAGSPTIIDGVAYDRIRFAASLFEELDGSPAGIILTRGGLEFFGDVIIETTSPIAGPGVEMPRVTLDAGQLSRVLSFRSGVDSRLSDLNLTGGVAAGVPESAKPGGGIKTDGNLWLTRVDVYGNSAESAGGGIYAANGDVWIRDSRVYDNSARYGGGISVEQNHAVTVIRSSLHDNSASYRSGGIDVIGALTVIDSTIHDNSSAETAGGITSYSRDGLIRNSTISGNSAKYGGGMFRSNGGTLRIENSTISANVATVHAGGIRGQGRIEFANTILGGNTAPQGPDALNTLQFVSLGHNIYGNTSQFTNPGGPFGGGSFTTGPADQLNVNPQLGPLGDNGGATLTHPLNPGSPAIDAGAAAFTPLMDQRGFPVTDIPGVGTGIPDIGSYEIQSITSSPWQYTALGRNQFGPGEALSFGFGFDDGKDGNDVRSEPHFLGFQFDTGPMKFGDIVDGPFGTKFGAELKARFAGKFGFEVGFYVNAGSVDVAYLGNANYVIDPGTNGSTVVSTYIDVNDGGLYTVSPKIGAYADLVVKLDADVSAQAALFGVIGADLIDIHVNNKLEMFSVNRQMEDRGRPLFLTDNGVPVSRDPKTGKYYDLAVEPQEIPDPGLVIPLLDGDIRYFNLGIEEVVKGAIESAKAARDLVNHVKAVRELNSANSEIADAKNEQDRLNKQLDQSAEVGRKTTSLKAQQEMSELAGPEYAAAVAQGKKGDELPEKKGKIRDAENRQVTAEKKKSDAQKKVEKTKKKLLKNVSAGVVIDTGKASGSLLGAEVKIGIGASIGLASVTKNIGTLQVTLPDVNLRDSAPNGQGLLTASTSDFRRNSEEDLKRQIASAQVDLGAFIPGFPGGTYTVSLGPMSLDVTTVSYNVGPQLNVTQDVQAKPVKLEQGLTYEFFRADGTTPESLQVLVNGVPYANGSSVHTVSFSEGDRVEVTGNDHDGNGQPDQVVVRPTLTMDSEFSNNIGLDIDLDGAFRAFGLSLSAFGQTLVEIGPLLKHNHTLAAFDLGSVFNKQFSLGTQTLALEPFTLFSSSPAGRTPASALQTEPTVGNADVSTVAVDAPAQVPVFVTVDQLDAADPDTAFTVLDVTSVSGGTISSVEVLDERLTVSGGTGGTPFRISGYTADILEESGAGLFAVRFSSSVTGAVVQVTRSAPISLSDSKPVIGSNAPQLTGADFERLGSRAVLNNDIDGDGLSLPETDGVLMIRYLAGFSGDALTNGALGANATRTDPDAIAAFIRDTLEQALPPDVYGTTSSTLDFDGDGGVPTALGDGVLLARYLDGRRGTDLTAGIVKVGASRQSSADIVRFMEIGRASANDPSIADFAEVKDRNGADVFGLNGKRDADSHAVAGSSATAAVNGTAGSNFSGGDDAGAVWEFELAAWGQSVDYEELYIDAISPANLISRIAVGSPTDFASDDYSQLLNAGGSSVHLEKQIVTATLGVDEPIYVRAPDAGGYEYQSSSGYRFTGFAIDPQVGGNLYQPAEFDLYLFHEASGQWVFDRLVTSADPSQLLPNGDLAVTFPGTGVTAFRLYSLAFRNRELHDSQNQDPPVVDLRTGLTLHAEPGASGAPLVNMVELAERLPFGDAPVATVSGPVFASDTSPVISTFTVIRDQHEQQVLSSTTGIGDPSPDLHVLIGSTAAVEVRGSDHVEDRVVLDASAGPLRIPVKFYGGFRTDTLAVSGANAVVDLIDRRLTPGDGSLQLASALSVTLSEVEIVDLRGLGDTTLLVDATAVLANDPWRGELFVRRDAGDAVPVGDWTPDGQWTGNGVIWDRYIDGTATLFVEVSDQGGNGGNFSAMGPAGGDLADSAGRANITGDGPVASPGPLVNSFRPPAISLFSAPHSPDTSQWLQSIPLSELEPAGIAGNRLGQAGSTGRGTSVSATLQSQDAAAQGQSQSETPSLIDEVFSAVSDLLLSELTGAL